MRPLLLLFLAVSLSAHAQAVAPMPAPVPVRPPPVMTPGYFPGSQGNPVYTPTGAGLPGERVPGTVAPPVPTSKGRILPREPDGAPGLWAADGAPVASTRGQVVLFRVTLPLPADADGKVQSIADQCAIEMTSAIMRSGQMDVVSYPKNERTCMAANALLYCAGVRRKERERTNLRDATAHRTLEAHATALVATLCKPPLTDEQSTTLKRVTKQWEQDTKM